MIRNKAATTLLALLGSIDWLTTIIGITYFGAVESNPFIADLAHENLLAFSVIKLGTAFFSSFLFFQAEKIMNRTEIKNSRRFALTRCLLRGAYVASLIVLLVAVVNNVLTVAS